MYNRSIEHAKRKFNYSPLRSSVYFEQCREIVFEGNTFRIYEAGFTGPILLLLHGGGYSSLTWALFSKIIVEQAACKVLAIDLRGHGSSLTTDDYDLSINTLTNDIINVLRIINMKDDPIVVIGHSMGGALAINVAHLNVLNIVGIAVIDVVEGLALKSLSSMQRILRNRPLTFNSIDTAIQWAVKSGQTRNIEAARISMPGQIINCKSKYLASDEILADMKINRLNIKMNIDENITGSDYTWRMDLSKTEIYWKQWFEGMSKKFLSVTMAKILILSSISQLDKELNIGNMQGKFQLELLMKCGHAIQEDQPLQVANIISKFLIRNKIAEPIK